MVQQLGYRVAIFGVFAETVHDEIFDFYGRRLAAREINLLVNHLLGLGLMSDLKRYLPEQQLVGQNADVPNIDFVVVALLLHHFR